MADPSASSRSRAARLAAAQQRSGVAPPMPGVVPPPAAGVMPQMTQQMANMSFQQPQPPMYSQLPQMPMMQQPSYGAPVPQQMALPPQQQYAQQVPPQPQHSTPAGAANRARRLDPRSLPNPTKVAQPRLKVVYNVAPAQDLSAAPAPPPAAHHSYICTDRGSCTPRFMRSTMYHIPTTKDILNTSHIPFAVAIQPLADVGYDETEVPVVNLQPNGPLRCRRCAAYINPFVKFIDNGRRYTCALCSAGNEIPDEYFSPIEVNGMRRDLAERVELWRGSVDFVAPIELNNANRSTPKPVFLFLLDVSSVSILSGVVRGFANSIRQILSQAMAEDPDTQVGFITYDKNVHFWKLGATSLQMVVIPDVKSVFTPLPYDAFIANYSKAKERIDEWLERIPQLFSKSDSTDSAFGAAVNAAMLSLGTMGGRIIAIQGSLPTAGPGALKPRDTDPAVHTVMGGNEREKQLVLPQSKFWRELGMECAKRHVCVDLFLCPSSYCDIATLGLLPKVTGGSLNYIPNFHVEKHEERLFNDIQRAMTRAQGSDAVLRVRTSEGIAVESYDGNFKPTNATEVEMAGIDADKTIMAYLKYEDNVPDKSEAIIQAAMLYTNHFGQRLIRVHTLALRVTSKLAEVFKAADVDTVLSTFVHRAITDLPQKKLGEIRTKLTENAIDILASYRKHCAKSSSDAQLILPDALKTLPVYLLSLLKHPLLNNSTAPLQDGIVSIADLRAFFMHHYSSISLEDLAPSLYGKLYHLNPVAHALQNGGEVDDSTSDESSEDDSNDDDGQSGSKKKKKTTIIGTEDYYGGFWLPPTVRLSTAELAQQGIYLFDDTHNIYLVVNSPGEPEVMSRLFDEKGKLTFNPDDEFNQRVHNMIASIRFRRPFFQPLLVFDLQQNHPIKRQFFNKLVEDGSDEYTSKEQISTLVRLSYAGYLCHIHHSIQNKM